MKTKLNTSKPLGEILAEAGLVSLHQIELALIEQTQHKLRIGELFASHGWIKQETADFFASKWTSLLQKKQVRPIAVYLFAAGLLTKEQLLILKQEQKKTNSATRLHSLAVKQGYVKQETVNFFLRHLLDIDISQNLSFTQSYKIIKNYISGETNFPGLKLSQIPLNGVNLKGIILDKSILTKANLIKSNFSYSSLVGVDLMLADLQLENLSHANLSQACLTEANLRQSNLERANFKAAVLQEADLRGANLQQASFFGADLKGAKFDSAYCYDVYYDERTLFSSNFDPIQAGWIKK